MPPSLCFFVMEILKRTKTVEIIPVTESEKNVREEVNKRTCKAGYTDRDGQSPLRPRTSSAGKGDWYRPVDKKIYENNYKRIFGHD